MGLGRDERHQTTDDEHQEDRKSTDVEVALGPEEAQVVLESYIQIGIGSGVYWSSMTTKQMDYKSGNQRSLRCVNIKMPLTMGTVLVHLTECLQDEDEEDGQQHVEVDLCLATQHGQESGSEEFLPSHWTGQRKDE